MQDCPDCAVKVGEYHDDNCDVARCARTGFQRLQCSHEDCSTRWTGEWPGIAECREYNLWCVWTDQGWRSCDKDFPGAREDLNTLLIQGKWSIDQQKFIIS